MSFLANRPAKISKYSESGKKKTSEAPTDSALKKGKIDAQGT